MDIVSDKALNVKRISVTAEMPSKSRLYCVECENLKTNIFVVNFG